MLVESSAHVAGGERGREGNGYSEEERKEIVRGQFGLNLFFDEKQQRIIIQLCFKAEIRQE